MVLFPVLIKAVNPTWTYRIVVIIQTVDLLLTPFVSYANETVLTVSVLYMCMSCFHLCRVLLFKYP